MRIELGRLHKSLATTAIYVTHDQVEAMTLADKIVVLRDGLVAQVGSPLQVYDDPDNSFVAGFIGSPKINFLKGVAEASGKGKLAISLPGYPDTKILVSAKQTHIAAGERIVLGLRPQHFSPSGSIKFKLTAELVEHLGGESFVYGGNGAGELITVAMQDGRNIKSGDKFEIGFDPARVLLFTEAGSRIR
jgi:lactose/L-arabinose transport system ATP-binding protein